MKNFLLKFVLPPLIGIICLITILQALNYNRVVLGLKVADLNIGGKTVNQAEASLLQYFFKLQNKEIILKYDNPSISPGVNKIYPAKLEKLGIILNPTGSLNSALLIGHKKNILLGLIEQIKAFFGKYNLEANFAFDENQLNNFILENLSEIEKPPQNASLVFNKKTNDLDLIPSQKGTIIDREKLFKDLKQINRLPSISLSLIEVEPTIKDEKTNQAKETALYILKNEPYILEYHPAELKGQSTESTTWSIDKETLMEWIEFIPIETQLAVSLNQEKVQEYLLKIAQSINQEPINAQLVIQEGRASVFSLAKKGLILNMDKNKKKITETILAGEQTIVLEADEIEPEITTTDDINNFGLTSLLGKGESNFAGSPKNRIHNIKIGALKMNGIILKPGEEFSFNNLLGEVGPEQDYLAELTIKKNKTIPEYGGGLCQVSTTVFRAAIYSGLKITERYAHAFPVKYYNPQGFDATIYPPHPDLRFINDTPNYLLIQSKIKGSQLTFEFYGTSDGRTVILQGPTQYDKKPDGSMKATLIQEIWRNGQLERKDTFKSNYKSPTLYPIERNPLE